MTQNGKMQRNRTNHLVRFAIVLAFVLGTTMFASAQDKGPGSDQGKSIGNEMSGVLCDQKCVKQDAGKNACDLSCSEKSGEAVFIDDEGKATKVANPEICKGKMGQKVKIHGKMMKDQGMMQVYDVVFANAG